MIELSFEGQSFYDICRWKRGDEFFNKSVQGWNAPDGATAESFYQLTTWQPRTWITPKSYLMPIPSDEINKSIVEVNDVVAQTAAAMNEAATAVNTLAGQSHELSDLIESMKQG